MAMKASSIHTRRILPRLVAGALVLVLAVPAMAQKSKAVREAVKYVMKKFGRELGEETSETLTSKLTQLSAKHGDEAIEAFRKAGPRTFRLVEEAGEHGPEAIKLMVRHGDSAAWVISKPGRMAIFIQHGDDAAEAMIKHKDIVLPLIERYNVPAARALAKVSGQNARRLVMMQDAGELQRIGRADELLSVIGRYGDRAADFVWRNKGALLVASGLAAFLSDPEPFINGTRDITAVMGDVAKEPLREAARSTNWTVVVLVGLILLAIAVWIRFRRRTGSPSSLNAGSRF